MHSCAFPRYGEASAPFPLFFMANNSLLMSSLDPNIFEIDCTVSPSREQAAALVLSERDSRPLVLRSLLTEATGWPCIRTWQHTTQRLQELVDPTVMLDVMTSSGREFVGDMAHHRPARCSFQEILRHSSPFPAPSASATPSANIYLAQSTILSSRGGLEGAALLPLTADFSIPPALSLARQSALGTLLRGALEPTADASFTDGFTHAGLDQCNLWLSVNGSRSSLHCDEYSNLLCVVRGQKSVRLLHPRHTRTVYPQALAGDSPNHARVDLFRPTPSFPLFDRSLFAQAVHLGRGDALFLPEGWWHQVDSECSPAADKIIM